MDATPNLINLLIPREDMLGIAYQPYGDEELARINLRPTVILCMGGTGYLVALLIKARIAALFGPERAELFQILVIDTAPEDCPTGWKPLGKRDFLELPAFAANDITSNI